jgi:hypothetical protein
MSSEPPKDEEAGAAEQEKPTASKDLSDGLQLMLSAAKKALKNVDPNRIEEVGRRAMKNLEGVDARKVGDLGRKAAKNLDPRKIEEVAEEAGRELLSVMERVADRVERIASGAIAGAKEGARAETKSSPPPPTEPRQTEAEDPSGGESDDKPRVRVGD